MRRDKLMQHDADNVIVFRYVYTAPSYNEQQ